MPREGGEEVILAVVALEATEAESGVATAQESAKIALHMSGESAAAGIPAEISQAAGTFVCNQVSYGLMRSLSRRPGSRGGFVRLPAATWLAGADPGRAMTLEDMVRGLGTAFATALLQVEDDRVPGGALH